MDNEIVVKKILFKNPLTLNAVFISEKNETCTGYFPIIWEGLVLRANYTSSINSKYNKEQLQIEQYDIQFSKINDTTLLTFLNESFFTSNLNNTYPIDPITPVLIASKIGVDYLNCYGDVKEIIKKGGTPTFKEISNQLYQYKSNINNLKRIIKNYNFLVSYGLETEIASKIASSEYRFLEKEFILNPYSVLKYFDISWHSIDKVALNNNIKQDSLVRKSAAVVFGVLQAIKEHSHICGNIAEIFDSLHHQLGFKLTKEDYVATLKHLKDVNEVRTDNNKNIYLAFHYEAENNLSFDILRLGKNKQPDDVEARQNAYLEFLNSLDNNIHYSKSQKNAIEKSSTHNLNLLLGPAGAGKTTTLKGIIDNFEFFERKVFKNSNQKGSFEDFFEKQILLLAPTNLAKERMQSSTGRQAHTLHSILGLSEIYITSLYNKDNQLPHKYVFVDEFSMVDTILTSKLLAAISSDCTVVLIGDDNQLPSIGPGRVLNELKHLNQVNLLELTEIFRQGPDSNIISLSQCIINENADDIKVLASTKHADLLTVHAKDAFIITDYIKSIYNQIIEKEHFDFYKDFQIITPMNVGQLGARKINEIIQKIHLEKNGITPSGKKFYLHDKVMQTNNNSLKKVHNGEIGRIIESKKGNLVVKFNSGKVIEYSKNESALNLELSFASSFHKMQGSEANVIMLIIHNSFRRMLNKNLLYTGCTRAKQNLILIGDMNSFLDGIKKNDFAARRSYISERVHLNEIASLAP